jgi:hypothetical protein
VQHRIYKALCLVRQMIRPIVVVPPAEQTQNKGYDIDAIAQLLVADEDSVRQALEAMRTPTPNPSRKTLNVTVAAQAFVVAEATPDEPYWQTVDRLFEELTFRRSN